MEKFDYILVGAGPAGCVLANRLSEHSGTRVLLLEAGPRDSHPFIHMPKGVGKIVTKAKFIWPFEVSSRVRSGDISTQWVRGKTLGGSSSINGLVYVRGEPRDYDDLAALTSNDWNWAHLRDVYRKMECHGLGSSDNRGGDGPLRISVPSRRYAVLDALVEAAQQRGLSAVADVNTPDNKAKVGYVPCTIFGGRRQSAAVAFLAPVRSRKNLSVKVGVLVDRILFQCEKAVGVECFVGEKVKGFYASKIILCAGTIGSPAVLQRSGIGDAALLQTLGITCVADRREVGLNLQEHCALVMQWHLKGDHSLNSEYHGLRLALNGLRYYLNGGGVLGTAAFDLVGWFNTDKKAKYPNVQFLAAPHSVDFSAPQMSMQREPGIQIAVYPLRPRSKGRVQITSSDLHIQPKIMIDYFADPDDRRELVEMVRYIRDLVSSRPVADFVAEEVRPGGRCVSDDDILEAIATMGTPAFHAVGTCRMGNDENSVVDPLTRVRGVRDLHVVDLSIAPFVLAGNTYGPVAALAWRAADLMI